MADKRRWIAGSSTQGPAKTKIMFLTKYVVRSSVDLMGPIAERYAGLYYSVMERFPSDYDYYWHAGSDGGTFEYQPDSNTLRPLPAFAKSYNRLSLVRLLFSFCLRNYKSPKIFVVSYPFFPKSLLLAVVLLLLKPFRVTVVVDVQDLPNETPGTAGHMLFRIVDQLYFLHAYFILNATECAKLFVDRARGRTIVIPMAANHKIIEPSPGPRPENGLTLGYLGTIEKKRGGFPELIELAKNLRAEGLNLKMVLIGDIAANINLGSYSWLHVHKSQPPQSFSKLLRDVDVGVIPYTDKEYCSLMSLTKMSSYMAAGLPVLSMQLTETSNILAKWDCGVSVEDWEGMTSAIRRLSEDAALRERLGKNARRAAVEEYNWERQAARMGEFLGSLRN